MPEAQPQRSTKPIRNAVSWQKILLVGIGWLMLVGASVIVAQLVVGYIMVAMIGADEFSTPVSTAIFSAISYILALLIIVFLPILFRKLRNKKSESTQQKQLPFHQEVGLIGWPTWTDIGLSLAGFIIYLILAAVCTSIFSLFPWFDASEIQDVGFSSYVVGVDRLIAFVTLVVIAPIAEEIIFRGYLYTKLRSLFSEKVSDKMSMMISILLVSLLFGLVHMQWNVGVNVFAMSVVLCALREVTGSIHAGILTHMIKNGVAFYLLFVLGIG